MSGQDLAELYQSVILDHHRNPRNFRAMADADRSSEGYNPNCGDRVTVWVKVHDGIIEDVSFQGSGCAVSRASASLMTTTVRGKPVDQAEALFAQFHDLVTGASGAADQPALGKLKVFSGVAAFPSRVKCASLPWHALHRALARDAGDSDDSKES